MKTFSTIQNEKDKSTCKHQTVIRVMKATRKALQILNVKRKEAPLYMEISHYHSNDKLKAKHKREIIPLPFRAQKIEGKYRFDMNAIAELSSRRNYDLSHSALVLSGNTAGSGENVSVHVPTELGQVHFDLTPRGDIHVTDQPNNLDLKIESCGKVIGKNSKQSVDVPQPQQQTPRPQQEKTHAFTKVRLIQATDQALKELKIKVKEAPLYLEISHGSQKTGTLKTELIPLPFHRNQIAGEERFNLAAIANQAARRDRDKNSASVLSGLDKGEGKRASIHIPTTEGDLLIELTPEGDAELIRIPKDMEFKLEIPGTVKTREDIKTTSIQIKANKFENAHKLTAKNVKLECLQSIQNKGSLLGEESVELKCNQGRIANAANSALASKGLMTIETSAIDNQGFMGATGKLETKNHCLLSNGETGVVMSETHLALQLASGSQNHGNLSSNDVATINGPDFENSYSGKISAKNALTLSVENLKNDGGVGASSDKAKLQIQAEKFDNGLEGFVHSAHDLKMNVNDLNNSGEMLTKFELNCKTKTLTTSPGSLLLSGNRAYLTCSEKSVMHGIAGAKVWTTLKAPHCKISPSAQLGGNGFVFVDVDEELENLGNIRGGRFVSLKGKKLKLNPESLVQADRDLQMDSIETDSAGTLFTTRDAHFNAKQNFTHSTGAYSEAKNTEIVANTAVNAGNIKSNLSIQSESFENLLSGRITANEFLNVNADIFKNEGVIDAFRKIYVQVKKLIENTATGEMSANIGIKLICDAIVRNAGRVECLGPVKIEAEKFLQELAESRTISHKNLSCVVKLIIGNAGTLNANTMELKTISDNFDGLVENLAGAKIITKKAAEVTTKKLSNAGSINSNLIINANEFKNLLSGSISAEEFIRVYSDAFSNEGLLNCFGEIYADIKNTIENVATGVISGNKSIHIICKSIIKNVGNIECLGPIKVEAEKIIQDLSSGKVISKDKLTCIAKLVITNAGMMGGNTIELRTTAERLNGIIENLESATILTEGNGTIESDTIKNKGKVLSQPDDKLEKKSESSLTLKARVQLENAASGMIKTANHLAIEGENGANEGQVFAKSASMDFKKDFTTSGPLEVEGDLSIHAVGTLKLLKNGKITVKAALKLLGDQTVYSEADMLAYQALTITTKLMDHAGGQIESQQDVLLTTVDWILAGKVKAAHDFVAKVSNHWDWKKTGAFQAENRTSLHLDKGYDFTRPIKDHPGSLEFHSLSDSKFINRTTLSSKKDLKTSGGEFINGDEKNVGKLWAQGKLDSGGTRFDNANGSVFGNKGLTLDHIHGIHNGRRISTRENVTRYVLAPRELGEHGTGYTTQSVPEQQSVEWNISNGSYMASNGPMALKSSKSGLTNDFGDIFTSAKLSTELKDNLDNISGTIQAGSADIAAKQFAHRMLSNPGGTVGSDRHYNYVLSAPAKLIVSQDCTFKAPVFTKGSPIVVGGKMDISPGCKNFSVEDYDFFRHRGTETYFRGKGIGREARKFFGKRSYRPMKPEDDKRSYANYVAPVVSNQIVSLNPNAEFGFNSWVNADHLNLQFSTMNVGGNDRSSAHSAPKFEANLKSYFNENSRLFRKKGDVNSTAYISPEVPLSKPTNPLPVKTFVGATSQASYFDEGLEILLIQKAMSENIGRITLDEKSINPESVLALLRQNALDYARSLGVEILTEAMLRAASKPMLIYRTEIHDGQSFAVSCLITPVASQRLMQGVYAKNADLEGGQGSSLRITGKMQIEGRLNLKVDMWELKQQTVEENVRVYYDKNQRYDDVKIQKAVDDTGVLHAGEMKVSAGSYKQIGGRLSSGKGGAEVKVEREVIVNPLRTTQVLQSNIDYSILPLFTPAYMMSEGDQSIVVTAGGMRIKGLCSHAAGENTLKARDKIEVSQASEEYQLPTTQSGRRGRRKVEGGTATSHLHNEFVAGKNLRIHSTQDDIALSNVMLGSVKNTEITGKNISILPGESRETHWSRSKQLKGFTYQETKTKQMAKNALLSSLVVGENLIVNAIEKIKMSGIKGLVGADFIGRAREVQIDGAKEEITNEIDTRSISLSFFGSQAIESICAGGSGREAVDHLMREDAFINAVRSLARVRDIGSATVNTFQTFIEGWRLAAMVGQACGENGFEKDKLLGSLTDRWGLTTADKNGDNRKFNPKFTLRFGKSHFQERATRTISASLQVLGNIRLEGDVIRLNDGTQLSASGIHIMARKLLQITCAEDVYESKGNSQGFSVGGTLRDQKLVSVGHDGSTSHANKTTHQSAHLNADTIDLGSGEKIEMKKVDLNAEVDLAMRSPEILHENVQDTKDESKFAYNVNVNIASPGISGGINHYSHHSKKSAPSVAQGGRSVRIETNTLKQTGSAFASPDISMRRFDGTDAPVNHEMKNLKDTSVTKNTSVNLNLSLEGSIPITGTFEHHREEEESIRSASFGNHVPDAIQTKNKKSNFGFGFATVNEEKISNEWDSIKTGAKTLSKAFSAAQQPHAPDPILPPVVTLPFFRRKNDNKKFTDGGELDRVSKLAHEDMMKSKLRVGAISREYESRGAGPGTISTGEGDAGGKSYGSYQLASKSINGEKSTLEKFLKASNYDKEFKTKPGSSEFDQKWKALAAEDPNFEIAQHVYIEETHFKPVAKHADQLGLTRTFAIDSALFSIGVQHGGAKKIVENARKKLKNDATEIDIIKTLYAARTDYVKSLSSVQNKKGVLARYEKELKDVLDIAGSKSNKVNQKNTTYESVQKKARKQ